MDKERTSDNSDTERKRIETALRDSEESLKLAQQLTHVGSWQWDLRTGVFSMSDEMLRIHGLPQGNPPSDVHAVVESMVHPDDRAKIRGIMEDVLSGGAGETVSFRIVRADGEVRWLAATEPTVRQRGKDDRPAVVLGTVQDITERKQTEEALKTAHMKLMTARDEERKHLAAELHDSVSQKLVALSMRLDKVALTDAKLPAKQGYELLNAVVICNELIADIKGICHGLYPPALEALGLVSAMKELEEYCRSAGLATAIHCDPVIARTRFGPEVEIALFRIAQEAVNNAIRHSHGGNIDIDLMFAGGQLVLAIVDDGEGFDMQAVEGKGLGLSSMRDRARAVGARLTITSEPGETRIEVSVAVSLEETNGKKG